MNRAVLLQALVPFAIAFALSFGFLLVRAHIRSGNCEIKNTEQNAQFLRKKLEELSTQTTEKSTKAKEQAERLRKEITRLSDGLVDDGLIEKQAKMEEHFVASEAELLKKMSDQRVAFIKGIEQKMILCAHLKGKGR